MPATTATTELNLDPARTLTNQSTPQLIEHVLAADEGKLLANGTILVSTGDYTGRSPTNKFLEDTPKIHDTISWGKINQPISVEGFELARKIATEFLNEQDRVFDFEGFVGADVDRRLGVRVITPIAWHALFSETLFIQPGSASDAGDGSWKHDWTVLAAGTRRVTPAERKAMGLEGDSPVVIAQSLEKKMVVILGSEYGGEIKKSLFYAMNYDMPDVGVFPMHCSANVAKIDPSNVALFFGLSGTGKTTLSADPDRGLIGDDEHGWGPDGIFNFEGGCYAKCINLSKEGEPQIWDAIRFGSVLENVVIDEKTRTPDYNDGSITQNTRVTYPVDFIPRARIPSIGQHPKNVIFLTADAFGVLPPVSKLNAEQAMYYFINGYTSKLAGTEAGVTEPLPSFSPCFGEPFMPRPPRVYAEMLADRIKEHGANVWLLNTGWTGGAHGVGNRFSLKYTRSMVTAILNGTLAKGDFETEGHFGLSIPKAVPGVPVEVLSPRNTWADKAAYDKQAKELAAQFRAFDAKLTMPDAVRAAGPKV